MTFINLIFRIFKGRQLAAMTMATMALIFVAVLFLNGFDSARSTGETPLIRERAIMPGHLTDNRLTTPGVQRAVLEWDGLDLRGLPGIVLVRHGMGEQDYAAHNGTTAQQFNRIFMNWGLLLTLIGLLAIFLIGYRLFWHKPLVPVVVVAKREIQGLVRCLGIVQYQEPITVRSQRTGTLEKLHVAQGDKVTKGQILAELIPSASKNGGAAVPGDTSQLVASAAGVISACNLAVGDEVYPGTPIFQIVEADQIRVTTRISEVRGGQVRTSQKAVIKLGSGRESEGEVTHIDRELDPESRQMEIQMKFHDLPDISAINEEVAVFIATGHQTAPAVPISAITSRNNQFGVLVVDNGLVNFHPVSLGVQNGKWIAALSGVMEGELVMITPEVARPGKEVRAEVMPAAFLEG